MHAHARPPRLTCRTLACLPRSPAADEDDEEDEAAGGLGRGNSFDAAINEAVGVLTGGVAGGGEGGEQQRKRPKAPAKPPVPLGQRKYVSSHITVSILEQEVRGRLREEVGAGEGSWGWGDASAAHIHDAAAPSNGWMSE